MTWITFRQPCDFDHASLAAFVRQTDVKMLAGSPAKLRSLVPTVEAIPFMDTLRWMLAA